MVSTTYRVDASSLCPKTCHGFSYTLVCRADPFARFRAVRTISSSECWYCIAVLTSLWPIVFVTARKVSGVAQYPRAVILPAAIQNQIFSKSGLRTRRAKLLCQVRQMPSLRSVRRKQPSFALSFSADALQFVHTIAHWDHPPSISSLAVRHKNDPLFQSRFSARMQ